MILQLGKYNTDDSVFIPFGESPGNNNWDIGGEVMDGRMSSRRKQSWKWEGGGNVCIAIYLFLDDYVRSESMEAETSSQQVSAWILPRKHQK